MVKGTSGRKHKKRETYNSYIYKVLKIAHPEVGITRRSMSIVNSFVQDTLSRLIAESHTLVRHSKRHTVTDRDIDTTVKVLLPGELAKYAIGEGKEAVKRYNTKTSK